MNSVIVNVQGISLPLWSGKMCEYAIKVLNEINCDNWELSILLCDDKTITGMNKQYRNKDEPTDILSFTLGETIRDGDKFTFLPGDIVISVETLYENAKYFQIHEDEELRRLIIHGILHLYGMDHSSPDHDCQPMLELQEDILNKLKNDGIICNINGGEI
jgi:probable rRNA maturation factor